eukprot:15403876-Alexandrium_andersonii.AAC.1
MIGRLVAGWSAYPFCAVTCPAGLRFRALSPRGMTILLAQIGYHDSPGMASAGCPSTTHRQ